MSNIKSLADQLRSKINEPAGSANPGNKAKKEEAGNPKEVSPKSHAPPEIPPIIATIRAYDNTDHKSMVHARFDAKTLRLMNQLKLATGIDVTKLVAFSVSELIRLHPELKLTIKQFFQNLNE